MRSAKSHFIDHRGFNLLCAGRTMRGVDGRAGTVMWRVHGSLLERKKWAGWEGGCSWEMKHLFSCKEQQSSCAAGHRNFSPV